MCVSKLVVCGRRPVEANLPEVTLATSSLPIRPQMLGLLSRRVTALQYGCSEDLGPNVSLTGVDFVFGRPRTVGSDVLVIGWTWQACHFNDFVASARNVSDSVAPVRNVQRCHSSSHPQLGNQYGLQHDV